VVRFRRNFGQTAAFSAGFDRAWPGGERSTPISRTTRPISLLVKRMKGMMSSAAGAARQDPF
jgi:hypothetical protein